MPHFQTIELIGSRPYRTTLQSLGDVLTPAHVRESFPCLACFLQIATKGLNVIVVKRRQLPQVLEYIHTFKFFSICSELNVHCRSNFLNSLPLLPHFGESLTSCSLPVILPFILAVPIHLHATVLAFRVREWCLTRNADCVMSVLRPEMSPH